MLRCATSVFVRCSSISTYQTARLFSSNYASLISALDAIADSVLQLSLRPAGDGDVVAFNAVLMVVINTNFIIILLSIPLRFRAFERGKPVSLDLLVVQEED